MREHLYRGFHECDNGTIEITVNGRKIKGDWIEGFVWIAKQHKDDKNWTYIKTHNGNDFKVVSETVGQYTGYSANKGEKSVYLYDEDIVRYKGKTFEIKREYGTPCLVRHQGDMFDIFEYNTWNDHVLPLLQFHWHNCDISEPYLDIEVIGNKWETPELVEEKQ